MTPLPPFKRSYWAIPTQLLAGCYPGDLNPAETDAKLNGLIQASVTLVVNLMEVSETDHSGKLFIDYAPRLLELAENSSRPVRCIRFPIPDQTIPSATQMRDILAAIIDEIKRGGVVYVHCWGGKGRTATVVGCFLIEQGLETQKNVLQRLQDLTAHASEFFRPTPQTREQCDLVTHWEGQRS